MKKIVLGLITLLTISFANKANAQFTFAKDTVTGYASDAGLVLHNDVTNTGSSSLRLAWRIISNNLPGAPSKWYTSFGLCDNYTCYTSGKLSGGVDTTDPITASGLGDFHIQYADLSGVTTYGPYYITVELKQVGSMPLISDTITFAVNKFPTSVNNVSRNNDIIMYPNPAHDDLNVVFDRDMDVKNIAVYNLIGKAVSVYRVTGNSAKLDISNIPSGIYFMKMSDSHGRILATRKFTHQ